MRELGVYYGKNLAVEDVNLDIAANEITAFIGPSGCGKTHRSPLPQPHARPHARRRGASARCTYHGEDLYGAKVDPAEVRRRIGMVFQKPNPFPKSIFDNVAYGPRLNGKKRSELDDIVEQALTRAALWDEVKDKLKESALVALGWSAAAALHRARASRCEPDVVLMDEPCSALDPIATAQIEDLMEELKREFTIVIVTHNMQQAARTSDRTAFFTAEVDDEGGASVTSSSSTSPRSSSPRPTDPRTEGYITGRFG